MLGLGCCALGAGAPLARLMLLPAQTLVSAAPRLQAWGRVACRSRSIGAACCCSRHSAQRQRQVPLSLPLSAPRCHRSTLPPGLTILTCGRCARRRGRARPHPVSGPALQNIHLRCSRSGPDCAWACVPAMRMLCWCACLRQTCRIRAAVEAPHRAHAAPSPPRASPRHARCRCRSRTCAACRHIRYREAQLQHLRLCAAAAPQRPSKQTQQSAVRRRSAAARAAPRTRPPRLCGATGTQGAGAAAPQIACRCSGLSRTTPASLGERTRAQHISRCTEAASSRAQRSLCCEAMQHQQPSMQQPAAGAAAGGTAGVMRLRARLGLRETDAERRRRPRAAHGRTAGVRSNAAQRDAGAAPRAGRSYSYVCGSSAAQAPPSAARCGRCCCAAVPHVSAEAESQACSELQQGPRVRLRHRG
jgi:hypothetical protein